MGSSKEARVDESDLRETSSDEVKFDGSLEFVHEYGGNGSKPSYQEVSGAPVENISPLVLQVTWFTTIFLNIGQMIGTGVFSTPATILKGVGSVGLSLLFWTLGLQESYFPNRSEAEVVYLEQAYPRPKYMLPTAFAVQSVLLSFSSSNTIVIAQYLYDTGGHTPTAWQLKGLAVGCMTFIILLVIFSTRWSLRISNGVRIIKIVTLLFTTGLVVLGGHTRVKNPNANFKDSFSGTTGNGYGLSNALVKVNFAYAGYTDAFNVVNEVKLLVCDVLCHRACYVGFLFLSPSPPRSIYVVLKVRIGTDRGTLRQATCGIYYAFWIFVLPHLGKYRIRQEVLLLSDETSNAHRLVKIPLEELEVWDREHDVLRQRIDLPG
ncbi:high affinity methionine permease [Hyaloscypha sp. PMI_1271]|nr:high affinity methionine permease [Hyaloscypha sp. PMI_1271]